MTLGGASRGPPMRILTRTLSRAMKPTVARRGHHEPAAPRRRIGLIVAPVAQRDRPFRSKTESFDRVENVRGAGHAVGLTAPTWLDRLRSRSQRRTALTCGAVSIGA